MKFNQLLKGSFRMGNCNQININMLNVEHFPESELISRLRKVTLLEDRDARPYENTFISLENISVLDLCPPQRYALRAELLKVRELKWMLSDRGIDLFNIGGFIRITLDGVPEPIDLLPPVVEETIERNGRVFNLVCDGLHRTYMALLESVIPQVIFIRGIPKNLPYYAFPISENDPWSKIEIRDDLPDWFIKKWHRIPNNKRLYRDFNSAFCNVGGPRGNWKK